MSTTTATLRDVASVGELLNVAATETAPLFERLLFEFSARLRCVRPLEAGANTSASAPDLFRELLHCYYEDVYGTRPVTRELQDGLVWYCCRLDRRCPGIQLIGFSLILSTLSTMSLSNSSSRPRSAACLTRPTLSIRLTSPQSSTTTPLREITIQQLQSSITVSAARSSLPAQRFQLLRSSPSRNRHRKRRRCVSLVTRSSLNNRCGCSATVPRCG